MMSEIFGEIYAPLYDAIYGDKDYDGETDLLERIFREYANEPVKKVLDLGCGTGNHAFRLAARGYQVVGVDRSTEMLKIANRKVDAQAQFVRFHEMDIRNLNIGEMFDAVVMMFAVLDYQLEDAHVLSTFQSARRHLKYGGMLVFDFWYGPAVLAQGPEKRVRTLEENGNRWLRTASGRLDRKRNCCNVIIQLRHTEDERLIDEAVEHHSIRYFSEGELIRFLENASFQICALKPWPAFDSQLNQTTWNAIAVASAV